MLSFRVKRNLFAALRSPALVVGVAFLLRMVLLWLSHYREDPSHPKFETVGLEALMVADSLAHGKGFSHPFPGYNAVTAWIAPVYPFLCSLGIRLFRLTSFRTVAFAQILNCAFSAATCWPIFAIGGKIFGEKTGLASAWLWAFLPNAVLLPLEWVWDQSLSAFLLALIVFATLELRESTSSLHWTWYGLLWGLTALANPTICLLLPFFLGWLLFQPGVALKHATGLAARAVLIFALSVLPWTIRNYYAIGGPTFVKSNFGLELWLGNNSAVKEVYTPELHPDSNFSQCVKLILNGEPAYNRAKLLEAVAYIEEHPKEFLRNFSSRFADTWAASYDSRVDPWVRALHLNRAEVWFCTAFSVISLLGLGLALRSEWNDSLLIATCLVLFPIPYYLTHTALRYRHPIDPFMTILSAYAAVRLSELLARRAQLEDSRVTAPVEALTAREP